MRVLERPGASVGHLPPGVEVFLVDIRDARAIREAFVGARTVFHLAANPNLWTRDRRDFDAINHQGTVHVLDAAIEAGADRILHCSTESILTRARSDGPIAEDVVVTEADALGPYCLSKLRAENAAMERARRGCPIYVANPTMPVGPGDRGCSPPTRLIADFLQGRLPAVMDCSLNLIDVRDVALGLIRVVDRGHPGRRYLLGGKNLTLVELLTELSKLTGAAVPRWRVPYPVGLAFAALSEFWADWLSGRAPQASLTGVRLTRRLMEFDCSRTMSDLDIQPRSIAISLREAVEWIQSYVDSGQHTRRKSFRSLSHTPT